MQQGFSFSDMCLWHMSGMHAYQTNDMIKYKEKLTSLHYCVRATKSHNRKQ